MSTLAVVEEVLRETAVPMSVKEIVERAGSRLPSKSKTPDTVVARDLSMDIKRRGEASLFVRTSPGRYTLRALWQGSVEAPVQAAPPPTMVSVTAPAVTPVLAAALRQERAAPLPARPPLPHVVTADADASRTGG